MKDTVERKSRMVEETLAMARTLQKNNPDGYPEVVMPRPPLRRAFRQNVIVCVHGRREGGGGNCELLVEWSLPPSGTNRLTWISEEQAGKLAPPEVNIFYERERGGRQASARDRMYRGDRAVHPEGMADAEEDDMMLGLDDGLPPGEFLGSELHSVQGIDGEVFDFRNVISQVTGLNPPSDSRPAGRHGLPLAGNYVMIIPDREQIRQPRVQPDDENYYGIPMLR